MGAPRTGHSQALRHWKPGLPVTDTTQVPTLDRGAEAPLFLPEDLSDSEEMFPKDITKWNSNDLMDKIESPEPEDSQGNQLGAAGPGEGS